MWARLQIVFQITGITRINGQLNVECATTANFNCERFKHGKRIPVLLNKEIPWFRDLQYKIIYFWSKKWFNTRKIPLTSATLFRETPLSRTIILVISAGRIERRNEPGVIAVAALLSEETASITRSMKRLNKVDRLKTSKKNARFTLRHRSWELMASVPGHHSNLIAIVSISCWANLL